MSAGPFATGEVVREFAEIVIPEQLEEDEVVELYTLPNRRASWARTRDEFVQLAIEHTTRNQDVYVGVSTKRHGIGTVRRGGEEDTRAALAVALDVDFGAAGHANNGKVYPPSQEAALDVLNRLPFPPSLVVLSGHGLHAWFLYKEPLSLRSISERNTAKGIALGWAKLFQAECRKRGWTADSTFDLCRLFRVAGTVNFKVHGEEKPVVILHHDPAARYSMEDFEPYAREVVASYQAGLGGLVLRADAQPDQMSLMAMITNSEKFLSTWKTERKDLKDQSPSGYCLALANMAVAAGWSDQEIADLLIAYRSKEGVDLKLRDKWYVDTIAKARSGASATRNTNETEYDRHVAERIVAVADIEDFEGRRTETLALLSEFTGLAVERISYTSRDPAMFLVTLATGESFVCSTKEILAQAFWVERSFDFKARVPFVPPSKTNWRRLTVGLAQYVTEFVPEESTLVSLLREYLDAAVDLRNEPDPTKKAMVLLHGRPVRMDPSGAYAFNQSGLHRWLSDHGQRLETEGLRARLRALGYQPRTVSGLATAQGRITSRRYWIQVEDPNEMFAGPDPGAMVDHEYDDDEPTHATPEPGPEREPGQYDDDDMVADAN